MRSTTTAAESASSCLLPTYISYLLPNLQVGVLSSLSGPECEGGTSEYVSVAANAEWLEEAVRELGGAKLARINKVTL